MLGCVHMGCRQAGYGRGHYPVDGLVSASRYIPAAPKPGSAWMPNVGGNQSEKDMLMQITTGSEDIRWVTLHAIVLYPCMQ